MADSLFDAAQNRTTDGPPKGLTDGLTGGLNERQLEAVTYRGGPLAVIAGPGTGKTRVITRRIASLIAEDGVEPERVVALTFTVKAGEEMRSRLGELLGASVADRIYAGTFHGFATRLLARFGDLAGMRSDLTLTDTALERRLMRSLVRDAVDAGRFPIETIAGEGIEQLVSTALQWRSTLAHDGVQPEEAQALVQRWHELAAQTDDEDAGAAAAIEAQMFERYAELYTRFLNLLNEQGLASYDDQMLLPVRLLERSELARTLARDAYRHVVVDEFQDVNQAQIRFLQMLAPARAGRDGPDLCVVGDDDQAIYGFRNATDLAFQTFSKAWPSSEIIALTDNHRSSNAVLAAANRCISQAITRAVPDKVITGKRVFEPAAPDLVESVLVENDRQIGSTIAAMIHAERAKNPELDLGSLAILCTSNNDAGSYVRALELAGIPAKSSLKHDASEPAIDDLFAWVELLSSPDATHAAQRLLTRAPFAIDPRDVGAWARAYRAELKRHGALGTDASAFVDFLSDHHGSDPRLRGFLDAYGRLDAATARLGAGDALRRVVADTGLAVADLPTPSQYARRVKLLASIISFADDRARFFDQPGDLASFWAYREDLEKDRFTIEDDDDIAGEGETGAVSVLTAHGSKGLEFDTVFVARFGQHGFGSSRDRGRTELPSSLRPGAEDTRDGAQRRQDEARRLFYVAVTRAERRLVLVSTKLKKRSQSIHYVHEITHDAQDEVKFVETSRSDVLERAAEAGAFGDAGPLGDRGTDVLDDRRAIHERVTAEARVRAAEALHIASTKRLAPDELSRLIETLGESARASAASRALLEGHEATGLASERVAASLSRLYERRDEGSIDPSDPRLVVPQRSPLRLSYSRISLYNACPLCYFTKHIAGLDDAPTAQRRVGDIAHNALEQFYKQWRLADADGLALPGVDRLLALARTNYETIVNEGATLTTADWVSIEAMLRVTYERLHEETPEIELLEEKHQFGYEHLGVRHSIEARIDRMDRLADGGVRIIDYKTGAASRALSEPKKDDLQLGLYVMAAEAFDGAPVTGVAEYWIMREGARGVLPIESLNRDKINQQITKAIEGLLAGDFSWDKSKCRGICEPMRSHATLNVGRVGGDGVGVGGVGVEGVGGVGAEDGRNSDPHGS